LRDQGVQPVFLVHRPSAIARGGAHRGISSLWFYIHHNGFCLSMPKWLFNSPNRLAMIGSWIDRKGAEP
jgi:hypothetical protein